MTRSMFSRVSALLLLLAAPAAARAAATELKGAAILDHPCGKLSVQHMGLVNAGKMDEAVKLATPEMQEEWKKMAAEERDMVSGMMKEMSVKSDVHAEEIKKHGVLKVDGEDATLTLTKEEKDQSANAVSTLTQKFKFKGGACAISH